MPSVGMRKNTRVFGARVLRSGRRLWSESVKGPHGENKFLENSADGGGDADNYQKDTWLRNQNSGPETKKRAAECDLEVGNVDIMCGIVYRRRRKRAKLTSTGLTEEERFGKKYVRKQWRAKWRATEFCGDNQDTVSRSRGLAIVVNGSSYDCGYWVACFLTSVLSYMTRVMIGMRQLSAFLLSNPIFEAYSSRGVLFLEVPNTAKNPGCCIISGSMSLMPLFSVDISAIPSFFVHMQTSISLRSAHLDCLLDRHYKDESETCVADDAVEELSCQISPSRDHDYVTEVSQISHGEEMPYSDVAAPENVNPERTASPHPTVGKPKSALRSLQLRNSRNIQKRRSSLRRKRGRPPTSFRAQKPGVTLASDFLRIRHDGAQFSAAAPTRFLRSSDNKRRATTNIKDLRSTTATKNANSNSCSANLLITEADQCYRVEGATISLQLSASKKWLIVISKGGVKRWSLLPQQVMRPPGSNRFTHAVVWAGDGGWKLEFVNKQDWIVFKELYKECSDRNLQAPSVTVIPVPRVQEVPIPVDTQFVPFVRPDSYISVKDDELSRALVKTSAYYDMDSDDEEWLMKLNEGKETQEIVTPESFELVIDALEKGFHYNPEEHSDEQAVIDFCVNVERKEVVEAIHKYWVKKRKQKRSALVRIFQLYQPRRSQVIPKLVYRKKRSFKRQASKAGKGKQRPLLQAMVAERDALKQQNNVQKLQQARAAVERYENLAALKRQRAQMLMENADLATYKAMMALRIAEAAQAAEAAAAAAETPSIFIS